MAPAGRLQRPLFNHRQSLVMGSTRSSSTSPQSQVVEYTKKNRPFSDIPGPGAISLPFMRHSAHVLPRIGNYHHTVGLGLLDGLRSKFGDLVRLGQVGKGSKVSPVLYVFDPETIQEVYDSNATEPPFWEQSPLQHHRKLKECPLHRNETSSVWAAVRALLQDEDFLKSYDRALTDVATDCAQRLTELSKRDNSLNVELETELTRWATEALGVVLLGYRIGCLDDNIHITDNRLMLSTSDEDTPRRCSLLSRPAGQLSLAARLARCARLICDANQCASHTVATKPDSEAFKEALRHYDEHYTLIEYFLKRALEEAKVDDGRTETILLKQMSLSNGKLLPLAVDFFLAGTEPLVQSAISMLYQLCLHPAKQQRAQDELTWASEASADGVRGPRLVYLTACAQETLRLHPATGGVVRRSRGELSISGYDVPDGVLIVLAHGVTSKLEKHWTRAEAFLPERWHCEGWEPLRASKAHTFAYLPFGELCPGGGIVTRLLESLASKILQNKIEWQGPTPKIAAGTNKMESPLYFVMRSLT